MAPSATESPPPLSTARSEKARSGKTQPAAEIDPGQVAREVRAELLARRNAAGHWRGHLASSALSTAVAAVALVVVARERGAGPSSAGRFAKRIADGVDWLVRHANADGGWGDTVRSRSNLPTTLLVWSALYAARREGWVVGQARADVQPNDVERAIERAEAWIRRRSGDLEPASLKRTVEELYGKDKTFSVPILTLAALAGVLGPEPEAWRGPPSLPFELAALPQAAFRFVGLPVVSYALPALIAVGQVQHHRRPSRNPLLRGLRQALRGATLRRLCAIQPSSGGFLEAIPLTGFVTLSLAGAGEVEHPVVERALDFLDRSVRDDGSWPIDIDLATWVTTLAVQGLPTSRQEGETAPEDPGWADADRARVREWLLGQQYRRRHPFTGAAPGGWAWTDLPGGVPDADDTPGALLALPRLGPVDDVARRQAAAGLRWLVDLQNRDGGLPTFCRGWAELPFDRSSPDLTAHALRAFAAWREDLRPEDARRLVPAIDRAAARALAYLRREQRRDGAWVPLWFGHEAAPDLANRVYGTARVVRALAVLAEGWPEAEEHEDDLRALERGVRYLLDAQSPDGGWGGGAELESSVEETALAVEALAVLPVGSTIGRGGSGIGAETGPAVERGIEWLCRAWRAGTWREATPIGFYFANLWYFEELYPLTFLAAALARVEERSLRR